MVVNKAMFFVAGLKHKVKTTVICFFPLSTLGAETTILLIFFYHLSLAYFIAWNPLSFCFLCNGCFTISYFFRSSMLKFCI